jgi:formate dehydrogenase major subunit
VPCVATSAEVRCSLANAEGLDAATRRKIIKPGDPVRVSTRRGVIELDARQDEAVPDGVVFIPFAFVEAAANLLTNPALDPFGKIPEFKYCAAKVEAVEPASRIAAE